MKQPDEVSLLHREEQFHSSFTRGTYQRTRPSGALISCCGTSLLGTLISYHGTCLLGTLISYRGTCPLGAFPDTSSGIVPYACGIPW